MGPFLVCIMWYVIGMYWGLGWGPVPSGLDCSVCWAGRNYPPMLSTSCSCVVFSHVAAPWFWCPGPFAAGRIPVYATGGPRGYVFDLRGDMTSFVSNERVKSRRPQSLGCQARSSPNGCFYILGGPFCGRPYTRGPTLWDPS